MHLQATETKSKASLAERAVILFDLLGNNRELLGEVPLISIFKTGTERFRSRRSTSRQAEKRQESARAPMVRRGTRGRPYR